MEEDKDICFYYFYPMFLFFLGFFFFAGLGLELRAYTLSYSTSPVLRFFFFFFERGSYELSSWAGFEL
jgi:hypothetical protein